jgi:transcriptional regulator with XRE-family HTH domain
VPKPEIDVPWGPNPPGGNKGEQARRVGLALARQRRAAAISEEELARLAGVSVESIRIWESGEGLPSANSLAHVLLAVAVSVEQSLGIAPPEETTGDISKVVEYRDPYLECTTVDGALGCWLDAALPTRQAKYREALLQRFGWSVTDAVTLQEAGDLLGVTRERIRQVEKDVRAALVNYPPPATLLDEAADAIWNASPLFVDDVSELLAEAGLVDGEIDYEALFEAMRLAGIHDIPKVFGDVIARSETEAETRFDYWARVERALRSGRPLHLIDLVDISEDRSTTAASTRDRLERLDWVIWLDNDWLVDGRTLGEMRRLNPLTNTVGKILTACGALSMDSIADGLQISARRSIRGLVVPPRPVLEAFLARHEGFVLNDDGLVGWAADVSGPPLAAGDEILVGLLRQRDHWGWADLRAAIVAEGLSEGFLSVNSQYSPLMMRLDHDQWCLREDQRPEVRGRGFARFEAEFGSELRSARLAAGLSQRELGELVGSTQPEISRWETGEELTPKRFLPAIEKAVGRQLMVE